jgi:hypothetical protein
MGLALDIFPPATLVAAIIALLVTLLGQRLAAPWNRPQFLLPLALGGSYFVGSLALAPDWAALLPRQPWEWLPYLSVTIAAGGAWSAGRRAAIRWLALLGMTLLAACLLAPPWAIFGVPWPASIAVAILYLLAVVALLELFPPRLPAVRAIGFHSLVAAIAAACIAAQISIRIAQLAALVAAALAGCWLALLQSNKAGGVPAHSLNPVFALLIGGVAYTACFYPERPLLGLLLLPILPLIASPFARRTIG